MVQYENAVRGEKIFGVIGNVRHAYFESVCESPSDCPFNPSPPNRSEVNISSSLILSQCTLKVQGTLPA